MTRKLSEIIFRLVLYSNGYIAKGGAVTMRHPREYALRAISERTDAFRLADGMKTYLRENGINVSDLSCSTNEGLYTLLRLADGKQEAFRIQYIIIYCGNRKTKKRLLGLGFKEDDFPNRVHGFYMQPEDYERFAGFLRKSGVSFELDEPPWVADVSLRGVKPSPDRPGKEVARFLGYI